MKSLLLCFPVSSMLWVAAASAQTAQPKDKEPSRPPQVRTYSTVTVVDDPSKAPRLPTQKQTAPTAKDAPPPPAKGPSPTQKDPSPPVAKEAASASAETGPSPRTDPKSAATGAAPSCVPDRWSPHDRRA